MNTHQIHRKINPRFRALAVLPLIGILCAPVLADAPTTTYAIQHSLTVKDIAPGAKKVRIWFWMPQDDGAQKVLDFAVSQAPGDYKITRDPAFGRQYLFCEVSNPKETSLALSTNFRLSRKAVSMVLDPAKAGIIDAVHQQTFANDLRRDVPNMEVTPAIEMLAGVICGTETNAIRQARKIYDYVLDNAEHYSKGEAAPKPSKIGSVDYCRANGGGSCTDMHALFSSLARARHIPTRLMFGSRLQAKNDGKEVDPGYRCSVEFFAPNYGWVPIEVAAGDTNADKRDFYFGGIDERRVVFNEGRDLDLSPKQNGPRLNLFIGAYVEVDGKPHDAWTRALKATEDKIVTQTAVKEVQADASSIRLSDATIATR